MKIHEIKEMKTDELEKLLNDEEKNMIDLRFSHQLKQLTNTGKLSLARKDIARMKTVLNERKLAEKNVANTDNKEGAGA
ncbi:MAG TPA: 50S ribosomal protein L29 [Ignavibacteriaceae bacterium]|nr:50S ribosomal protein L29 [Ignavibacteriaceae bacterium]